MRRFSLLGPLRSLLTPRAFQGAVIGAVVSVIVCTGVGLLTDAVGIYGSGWGGVWTLNASVAALRGAVIGFFIGRYAFSPRSALTFSLLGAAVLIVFSVDAERLKWRLYATLFDFGSWPHCIINALLIGLMVYKLLGGLKRSARVATKPALTPSSTTFAEESSARMVNPQ